MKIFYPFLVISFFLNYVFAQVGINTTTPQETLHVNGSMQLTNELNVGGDGTTKGNSGESGQVLTSQGENLSPKWISTKNVSGVLAKIDYLKGTSPITVLKDEISELPGLSYTITVPEEVVSQTLDFIIVGYAAKPADSDKPIQGTFSLYKSDEKLTSAYVSNANDTAGGNSMVNLPIPTTLIYQITLTPGTYNFKVKYKCWTGTSVINFVPGHYKGYDNDAESMLSRMRVQVFNN